MHNSLRIVLCAATAVCIFVSACETRKSYVGTERREFENITVEIPKFKNLSDDEFEKELNEKYEQTVAERIEKFLSDADDECEFELKQEIKLNKSPVITVVGEIRAYDGGVRDVNERIAKNIDVVKNTELKLYDLFEDNSYINKLNREIENITESNPEEYHDLWEKPIISDINRECFYLTDKALVIFYPPYELSYYAKGFVEFYVPYDNIRSYLKEEYKCL